MHRVRPQERDATASRMGRRAYRISAVPCGVLETDLVDGFLKHGQREALAVLVAILPRSLFLLAVRPTANSFAQALVRDGGAQPLRSTVTEAVHRGLVRIGD